MSREYVVITEALRETMQDIKKYASLRGISVKELACEMGWGASTQLQRVCTPGKSVTCVATLHKMLSAETPRSFLREKFGDKPISHVIEELSTPKTDTDNKLFHRHALWTVTEAYMDLLQGLLQYAHAQGMTVVKLCAEVGVADTYIYYAKVGKSISLQRLCLPFRGKTGASYLAEKLPGQSIEAIVESLCPHYTIRSQPRPDETAHKAVPKNKCKSLVKVEARAPCKKVSTPSPQTKTDRSSEIAEVLSKLESLHQATAIEYRNLQELLKDSSLVSTKSLAELLPKH